eukprot:c5030_g1_i1.p1 GENE.c5030_g1_i1~~c5030_g1_i1.p1  ORF type:complete len:204 (+),score=36.58 c5030_g1_i1:22-612(+)
MKASDTPNIPVKAYFASFLGEGTNQPRWRAAKSFRKTPSIAQLITSAVICCLALVPLAALNSKILRDQHWRAFAGPLGASCFLVFAHPQALLAQPPNVILSHVIGAVFGLIAQEITGWIATICAVGLTLFVLELGRIGHPPSGGTVIVAATNRELKELIGWKMVAVVAAGATWLVLISCVFHNMTKQKYPRYWWMF